MSEAVEIPIYYAPHQFQRELHDGLRFHRHDKRPGAKRFALWVCHRRFGKTFTLLHHLLRAALSFPRNDGRFGYVAPFRAQAKLLAWDYIKRFAATVPGHVVNEAELRIDFPNGSRIMLFGADNPDAIRGAYFDLVALDEYGQMHRRIWGEVVRPMLADREGGAIVSGTPKGQNAFFALYTAVKDSPEWDVRVLPLSKTLGSPGLPISEAEQAALLADIASGLMSQEQYDQEFECSWSSAMIGSYFGKLLEIADKEDRIARVLHDPIIPVTTAWDLGMRDSTVVWFAQALSHEVRVLKCMTWAGTGLERIVKDLRELPYNYSEHLLPHDIQVRELGTGRSRYEVLMSLGINARVMPRLNNRVDNEEDERIQAVRQFIPRCVFDRVGCEDGLNGLRSYRLGETTQGMLGARPLHDWASDYADAFGLMAQGLYTAPRFALDVRVNPRWAAPS